MNSIEVQKQLTDRELIIFNSELDRTRKNTGIAYLLYFLLGTIGGHKFYLGKPLTGIFYMILLSLGSVLFLVSFASAFDPSTTTDDISTLATISFLPFLALGIMLLLDLFTIPSQIKKQEDRVRNQLLTRLTTGRA